MKPTDLTPQQGKCLRYVVARTQQMDRGVNVPPIKPDVLVTKIEWSDLPHSLWKARQVLQQLARKKLVEGSDDGYAATEKGITLITAANKAKLWQESPGSTMTKTTTTTEG